MNEGSATILKIQQIRYSVFCFFSKITPVIFSRIEVTAKPPYRLKSAKIRNSQ